MKLNNFHKTINNESVMVNLLHEIAFVVFARFINFSNCKYSLYFYHIFCYLKVSTLFEFDFCNHHKNIALILAQIGTWHFSAVGRKKFWAKLRDSQIGNRTRVPFLKNAQFVNQNENLG